jgi:hypothetical protein
MHYIIIFRCQTTPPAAIAAWAWRLIWQHMCIIILINAHACLIQADAIFPMLIIDEEHFGANNITVTLEWFQNGVVFNNVHPPASVRLVGNRSVQLTIPYNIEHNVSVATCGRLSPEPIKLHYGKSHACIGLILS